MQLAGGLTAALTRAGSGHISGSPSNAEEWMDPLSVAALELLQRGRLVSQSSAIASALQVSWSATSHAQAAVVADCCSRQLLG